MEVFFNRTLRKTKRELFETQIESKTATTVSNEKFTLGLSHFEQTNIKNNYTELYMPVGFHADLFILVSRKSNDACISGFSCDDPSPVLFHTAA